MTAAEIFSQGYWQRTYSALDDSVIKKSSIFAGLGCFLTVLILGIAGSSGAGLDENPSLRHSANTIKYFLKAFVIGLAQCWLHQVSTHYKVQYHQQWL